MQAVKDALK
jgi:receptor expression-enhancing protein 5/6